MFKVRRTLVVVGGSVDIGSGPNLYRSSSVLLKTDVNLEAAGGLTLGAGGTVTGTFTAKKTNVGTVIADAGTLSIKKHLNGGGTTTVDGGSVTGVTAVFSGSVNAGTQCVLPYGASAVTTNGEIKVYHGTFLPHFTFKSGGTQYTVSLPNVTAGTMLVTVGSPPD